VDRVQDLHLGLGHIGNVYWNRLVLYKMGVDQNHPIYSHNSDDPSSFLVMFETSTMSALF
jgi:hypothetical protein